MENNSKKVVTKEFLQKYHYAAFKPISEEDFDKLSEQEKNNGITYLIYDRTDIMSAEGSFQGATATSSGTSGSVPAPGAGDDTKVLFGNGHWQELPAETQPDWDEIDTSSVAYIQHKPDIPTPMIGNPWDENRSYQVGECVIYNNALYKCLIICKGIQPLNNSTYWQPIILSDVITDCSNKTSELLTTLSNYRPKAITYDVLVGNDCNEFRGEECHLFTYSTANTPEPDTAGFLDVDIYYGTVFEEESVGVARQTFTVWDSANTYIRTFSFTKNTWTPWLKLTGGSESSSSVGTSGSIPGVQNFLALKKRYDNADHANNTTNQFSTFLHITDIHNDETEYRRAREIADELNVDGIFMTGDMVANDSSDDFSFVTSIEANYTTPAYLAIGNHDSYGMEPSEVYDKYYAPFTEKYGYNHIIGADTKNNYYKDLDEQKLRIISLDLYNYNLDTPDIWAKHNPHYTKDLLDAFASMLEGTPNDYGIIVICHSPEKALVTSEGYDKFKQKELYHWQNGAGFTTLTDILDAYISRVSVSGTHINSSTDNSTVDYSYDFSDCLTSTEFIAWVTGHTHTDNIHYVPETVNKQLMLNMACSGIQQWSNYDLNEYNDLARNHGDDTANLINGYIIDREKKLVKVVRIGAHLTYDAVDRNYMLIPYK